MYATHAEVVEQILKHQPGKHNQQTHGKDGAGGAMAAAGDKFTTGASKVVEAGAKVAGAANFAGQKLGNQAKTKAGQIENQIRAAAAKSGQDVKVFAKQKGAEAKAKVKSELSKFMASDDWGAIKLLGSASKMVATGNVKNARMLGKVAQGAGNLVVQGTKKNIETSGKIAGAVAGKIATNYVSTQKQNIKLLVKLAAMTNPVIGLGLTVYNTAKTIYKVKKGVGQVVAGVKNAGAKFNEADQKVHNWSNQQRAKLFGKSDVPQEDDDSDILGMFQEIIGQIDAAKQSPEIDDEDKANLDQIRSTFSALQQKAANTNGEQE